MSDIHFLAWTGIGAEVRTLTGPDFSDSILRVSLPGTGKSCAFSPDGQYLAAGCIVSPFLTVTNTSDWSKISGTPTLSGSGNGCAFSPDGQYLAVAHGGTPCLTIINMNDWSEISGTPTLPSTGNGCAFSPDGQYLAVAHAGTPCLTIINMNDWSEISGTPTLPSTGFECAFSPDGQYLAAVHAGTPFLTIINTNDWSEISGAPTVTSTCYGCAFSPDGQYLAVAHVGSPYLTIINTSDWSKISGTPNLSGTGYECAFSPDGQYLAAGHMGSPYLTVTNTSDWSKISGTPTLSGNGNGCAWLPDIDPPRRDFVLFDHDGESTLQLPVHMLRRPAWSRVSQVQPNDVGAFTLFGFISGDYHLLIPDTREGALEDKLLRVTLDETTKDLDPLPIYMPYAGALTTLSGQATKATDGAPIDDVVVRAWASHEFIARATPDDNGDWSVEVPPGRYDITFRALGCAPVCHGPYLITEPAE